MAKTKTYPLYEPVRFTDLRAMCEDAAEKWPEDIAFSYKERPTDAETVTVTYTKVRNDVRELGTALVEQGCREAHCAIIGCTSLGWAYAYFALMAVGAVTVPLDKEWPQEELAAAVNRAACAYVFYTADIADKIDYLRSACPQVKAFYCAWGTPTQGDLCRAWLIGRGRALLEAGDNTYYDYTLDPDRMASIVFTSGTTGKGKGVMLSQTNICSDMTGGMVHFHITRHALCVLPLHHTFGSTCNLVGHFVQGSQIYFTSGLRYFAKEMQEQHPTHLMLVPLFLDKLYKKIWATARKSGQEKSLKMLIGLSGTLSKLGIDARRKMFAPILDMMGGKVELIVSGGAPLKPEVARTFEAMGITVINGYGITECAPLVSVCRNKYSKPGSVGLPNQGEEVRINEPDENGEGEILVKGPNVMLGYYQEPEATAAVFTSDGFFRTGDMGRMDEDGWLYITGRIKNLIILANGKNVYPEEIEEEISRIPGVEEVVVFAGESKSDAEKETIVAEIFPDFEYLRELGIADSEKYFAEQVTRVNRHMASYKTVGLVKLRSEEFRKNTSKKITRFSIDKTID